MRDIGPIIIIQNIDFHFEIAISLYSTLVSLGYETYIYLCKTRKDYQQEDFLRSYNIKIATESIIDTSILGVVVTAYPDQSDLSAAVPNINDRIFTKLKNKLFIVHRFKHHINDKLIHTIHSNNCLSLSPISSTINIDHLELVSFPISPAQLSTDNKPVYLSVQANFDLHRRQLHLLFDSIKLIKKSLSYTDVTLNCIGRGSNNYIHKNPPIPIHAFNNLNENDFYFMINNQTHFIVCLIDNKFIEQSYAIERYSTNFFYATIFNKPIICHEFFKNIYNIPGLYYNDFNFHEILNKAIHIDNDKYKKLIENFSFTRQKSLIYNESILSQKIKHICGLV